MIFFVFRGAELKEDTLRKNVEDLEQALEERSLELKKLSDQKNFEIKALKNDLVSWHYFSKTYSIQICSSGMAKMGRPTTR